MNNEQSGYSWRYFGNQKISLFRSLRSRRYSRARENGKLEIPPAQKRHILSSPRQLSAGAF